MISIIKIIASGSDIGHMKNQINNVIKTIGNTYNAYMNNAIIIPSAIAIAENMNIKKDSNI